MSQKKKCEKQRYPNGGAAMAALKALQAQGRTERSFYHCLKCDGYHLTSLPRVNL